MTIVTGYENTYQHQQTPNPVTIPQTTNSPPLTSIGTGFENTNQHQPTLNPITTPQTINSPIPDTDILNSFLGQYITKAITMELNRRLTQTLNPSVLLAGGMERPAQSFQYP